MEKLTIYHILHQLKVDVSLKNTLSNLQKSIERRGQTRLKIVKNLKN